VADPVVDALNEVYKPLLKAFEQFHRQEHRFQIKYQYKKLVVRFDCLVHHARGWRRAVLNRIERLGGDAESVIDGVVVKDEVKDAYKATLDLLTEIYDAINLAVAAAQAANDHPTHKILMRIQTEVDHKRCKIEAWLRQVSDLRDTYLVTVVN
jgi:bacterioferritin (cytochrome b1)